MASTNTPENDSQIKDYVENENTSELLNSNHLVMLEKKRKDLNRSLNSYYATAYVDKTASSLQHEGIPENEHVHGSRFQAESHSNNNSARNSANPSEIDILYQSTTESSLSNDKSVVENKPTTEIDFLTIRELHECISRQKKEIRRLRRQISFAVEPASLNTSTESCDPETFSDPDTLAGSRSDAASAMDLLETPGYSFLSFLEFVRNALSRQQFALERDASDPRQDHQEELMRRALSGLLAQAINRFQNQGIWVPDTSADRCYQCHRRFAWWRRRHHCRLCGFLFCAACCKKHPATRNQTPVTIMTCDVCNVIAHSASSSGEV